MVIAITIIPIPPSHCKMALQIRILFGALSKLVIIVDPVVVIPDIASKNEFVSRVQSLNPDSWLAGEEVILRIEKFDSEVAAIQGLLSNA